MGSKKEPNSQKQRVEWWLPGAARRGNREIVVQRIQTANYKMNKFRGSNSQCGDYSEQYYVVSFKVAKRVDLKYSHNHHQHRKGNLCKVMNVLTNFNMAITLQYI